MISSKARVEVTDRTETSEYVHTEGLVHFGRRERHNVGFQLFQPKDDRTPDEAYLIEGGLGNRSKSMEFPTRTIAKMGHAAFTLSHTHHAVLNPIGRNALDMEVAAEALTPGRRVHGVGMSRGGMDTTFAAERAPQLFRSATLVGSAGFVKANDGPGSGLSQLAEHTSGLIHNPEAELHMAGDFVHDVMHRPEIVLMEAIRARTGSVIDRLRKLRTIPGGPRLQFVALRTDCFFDEAKMWSAAQSVLPFNAMWKHDGGHCALARDRELTENIVFKNQLFAAGERLDAQRSA